MAEGLHGTPREGGGGEGKGILKDLRDVPSWVWLGGAAGIGLLWVLKRSSGAAAPQINPALAAPPAADTSGDAAALQANTQAIQQLIGVLQPAPPGGTQPVLPAPPPTSPQPSPPTAPTSPYGVGGPPASAPVSSLPPGAPNPTPVIGTIYHQANGNPYWFNPPVLSASMPVTQYQQMSQPTLPQSTPVFDPAAGLGSGAALGALTAQQLATQRSNAQQYAASAVNAPVDPTTGQTAGQLLGTPRAYPGGPVGAPVSSAGGGGHSRTVS